MKALFGAIVLVILIFGSLTAQKNEMAFIRGGSFVPLYGNDSTPVSVNDFYIDKLQVTNEDFLAFVKEYPQWQKTEIKKIFADANYLKHWASGLEIGPQKEEIKNSPVVNVSWFAAKAYCECQGKRLPYVNEWEFSARASESKPDASGDEAFYQRSLDWYSMPNPKYLPAVDKGFKNFYGIYGMIGTVWEWALDYNSALLLNESRANSSTDREAFCGAGSRGVKDAKNYVAFMRYAFRSSLKTNYTVANLGFRCAKDTVPSGVKIP